VVYPTLLGNSCLILTLTLIHAPSSIIGHERVIKKSFVNIKILRISSSFMADNKTLGHTMGITESYDYQTVMAQYSDICLIPIGTKVSTLLIQKNLSTECIDTFDTFKKKNLYVHSNINAETVQM
jgi:hypothetical protein